MASGWLLESGMPVCCEGGHAGRGMMEQKKIVPALFLVLSRVSYPECLELLARHRKEAHPDKEEIVGKVVGPKAREVNLNRLGADPALVLRKEPTPVTVFQAVAVADGAAAGRDQVIFRPRMPKKIPGSEG